MIFDKISVKNIQNGNKTVTRRLLRLDNRRPAVPGHVHKIKTDRSWKDYGKIKIISCYEEKLEDITNYEAKLEGFNNRTEYLNYFELVNGTQNPKTNIWRVEFEVIENPTDYQNIGRIDCNNNNAFLNIICNGKNVKDYEIVYIDDIDNVFEDIYYDLSKYVCNFIVNDGYIDYDKKEFVFDIEEYNNNDYKISSIKNFKDWINNTNCDWFYYVDRYENIENGLRIYLKF